MEKVSIQHYSVSISRVHLKYQNYNEQKVATIKETTGDDSYDAFYQPAVSLLIKMYETKKQQDDNKKQV